MRAAVYRSFGEPEVVRIEEVARPIPGPGEVLLEVRATTVSAADHRTRSRRVPRGTGLLAGATIGFRTPRIPVLGMDAAGVVVEVGEGVEGVAVGDEVIALLGEAFGGHAEYALVRAKGAQLAPKPPNLGWEEAVAIVFGGWTAEWFLRAVDLGPGTTVLVNGASGAVGSAAVQLAALRGAEVTGVTSGANAGLVRDLGAARIIDYTAGGIEAEGAGYDVVVDCVGNLPFARLIGLVAPRGALLAVIADLPDILLAAPRALLRRKRVLATRAPAAPDALRRIAELAAEGRFRPVIDRIVDFDEIVEAHRRVDSGRKRGAVVVRVCAD